MEFSHFVHIHLLLMVLVGVVLSSIFFGSLNGEGFNVPLRLNMQRRQTRDQCVASLQERKLELLQDAIRTSNARAHALGTTRTPPRRRSELESSLGSSYILPVIAGAGDYVTEIQLGSPPRKQEVIVDTGSDLLWIQCEPCIQCYSQKYGIFDPNSSTTIEKQQCSSGSCHALPAYACDDNEACIYGYQYGDGSQTHGDLVTDILTLSSSNGNGDDYVGSQKIVFGCGHENDGFSQSEPGPSGLVGLGRGPLSLVEQIYNQIDGKFSYCLVDWDSSSFIRSPLFLGSEHIPYGTQFTPILVNGPTSTFYYVRLEGMSIGGKKLPISPEVFEYTSNGGGTIFDSGTTLTYLPPDAQTQVTKAIMAYISSTPIVPPPYGFELCYSGQQNYPEMIFHFSGNANMKVPSQNYMMEIDPQGTACLITSNFGDNFTIIGNLQQQNMHIFHDLSNSRIGFFPTSCEFL